MLCVVGGRPLRVMGGRVGVCAGVADGWMGGRVAGV